MNGPLSRFFLQRTKPVPGEISCRFASPQAGVNGALMRTGASGAGGQGGELQLGEPAIER